MSRGATANRMTPDIVIASRLQADGRTCASARSYPGGARSERRDPQLPKCRLLRRPKSGRLAV